MMMCMTLTQIAFNGDRERGGGGREKNLQKDESGERKINRGTCLHDISSHLIISLASTLAVAIESM
jgi:hypothetical protein